MESSSGFSNTQAPPDGELLNCGGSTCDCFRVKLYGKLHFKKRLKEELRTDPRYVSALQKEFETGYRLEHPHLLRYLLPGDDYFLTEYIDGETLDVFMAHHPDFFLHHGNADRFLRQLLDVVSYLHQHQVVHLDLKPSNIMITRVGNDVKLVDLGFCYTDTYTDTMGRTDKYAAPEQLNDSNKVDARTDIYAIGRILEQMPCARFYKKVIRRCTAPKPEDRYQTIYEIWHDVKRKTVPGLAIGIAILIVLSVLFFFIYPSTKTEKTSSDTSLANNQAPTTTISNTDTLDTHAVKETHSEPPLAPEVTAPVKSQNDATTEDSGKSKAKLVQDSIKLRKIMEDALLPLYQKYLGEESNQDQGWVEADIQFQNACPEIYVQLRKKYEGKYSKDLFDEVWSEVRNYYRFTKTFNYNYHDIHINQ